MSFIRYRNLRLQIPNNMHNSWRDLWWAWLRSRNDEQKVFRRYVSSSETTNKRLRYWKYEKCYDSHIDLRDSNILRLIKCWKCLTFFILDNWLVSNSRWNIAIKQPRPSVNPHVNGKWSRIFCHEYCRPSDLKSTILEIQHCARVQSKVFQSLFILQTFTFWLKSQLLSIDVIISTALLANGFFDISNADIFIKLK